MQRGTIGPGDDGFIVMHQVARQRREQAMQAATQQVSFGLLLAG